MHYLFSNTKESIGTLVKNAFQNRTVKVSTLVESLMNPNDINMGEHSMHKYSLEILQFSNESQYKKSKLANSTKQFRLYYLFATTIMSIFIIYLLASGNPLQWIDILLLIQATLFILIGITLFLNSCRKQLWTIAKALFIVILIGKCVYDFFSHSFKIYFSILL